MTEKRYEYLNYSRDGYIGSFFENDKPLTNKEVVDRLKEQDSEIKRLKQIREEQIETILKQKRKIKELEEENGRMKGAFKRKFDYDIEDVVDEICDEDW